jgi:hypothetical protein
MYPIQGTSDKIMEELIERTDSDLSLQECRSVVNSFTDFIKQKIGSMEEPYFRIEGFGDYRLSPYEMISKLKRLRNTIATIDENVKSGKGTTVKQYKYEYYLQLEKTLTRNLSIFSRIYGRTYMEKKFSYFKELDIPEYELSKEELINNTDNYMDFTEKEFVIYSDEELKKILNK